MSRDQPTILLSQEYSKRSQTVTMTRTYQVPTVPTGHVVRVTVTNNVYRDQSSARAEVLTPALTWTQITHEPVDTWYETRVPSIYKRDAEALETAMRWLCEELVGRTSFLLQTHLDSLAGLFELRATPDPAAAGTEGR